MKQVEYQISLFDGDHKLTIDKPIRLIELFAGYGSQALALKYLGANFEHWKICEWAVKSIQAYKDLHFGDDNTDYSATKTQDEVINYLYSKGISANYNEPMTIDQIKRLGEEKQRVIYNNLIATHNLVSVCNCHASDLEISDTDKYTYIMTYSYPCQDCSSAGKRLGMEKGSGTRSSLLWEVERILDECNGKLPQILLMENVPEVIGTNNSEHFSQWVAKLDSLGYKSKWEILNAKDYGVPQNRARCFMVSWLGNYYYDFPTPIKLENRLKDVLETNVDEKYYLSDAIKKYIVSKDDKYRVSNGNLIVNRDIACSKTTREGCTRADTSDYISPDLMPNENIANKNTLNYRIRKLTPKECGRLMGVRDKDIDTMAVNQSNSSQYHLYGDSIVVGVLMAIFGQML